jgi:hypothetical protein
LATVVEQLMLTLQIGFAKSCFAFFRTMQQQRQLGAHGQVLNLTETGEKPKHRKVAGVLFLSSVHPIECARTFPLLSIPAFVEFGATPPRVLLPASA